MKKNLLHTCNECMKNSSRLTRKPGNSGSLPGEIHSRKWAGIILFIWVLIGCSAFSSTAQDLVSVEAESGRLGSDWITADTASLRVRYISPATDFLNTGYPDSTSKVSSYTVLFKEAGTYDLFARVWIGPQGGSDDSFYVGNGFGEKHADSAAHWRTANQIDAIGYNFPSDVVSNLGSIGTRNWKWINISDHLSLTYTVPDSALEQIVQIGGRENGLKIDKLVFGKSSESFTVSQLNQAKESKPVVFIFEAESGSLGSDWIETDTAGEGSTYITSATDFLNAGYPDSTSKVATYQLRFPSTGTYELYARVWIGPAGANDDSYFTGNGFGEKHPDSTAHWRSTNQLDAIGYTMSSAIVDNGGNAGASVWKWINISNHLNLNFSVPDTALVQTFQIGGRENGLRFDKFAFGEVNRSISVRILDEAEEIRPVIIPFEAEAGVLGADWIRADTAAEGETYITSATNFLNTSYPDSVSKVASYRMAFPESGPYELYARIWVGPAGANDDSYYTGNGFGEKHPDSAAHWRNTNQIDAIGYNMPSDTVDNGGNVTSLEWKWINISNHLNLNFSVPDTALVQTLQIGGRENGLNLDKFAFAPQGAVVTVDHLNKAQLKNDDANTTVIQAEDAAVFGSDWVVADTTSEGLSDLYATPATDFITAGQPDSTIKVATYDIQFNDGGTYDLYARLWIGPGGGGDDSFFLGRVFGQRHVDSAAHWAIANQMDAIGYNQPGDIVLNGGNVGTNTWKWVNISDIVNVTYTVPDSEHAQILQIAGRENGLKFDKFVFGKSNINYSVAQLDKVGGVEPSGPSGAPVDSIAIAISGGGNPEITSDNGTLQLMATVFPENAAVTSVTWSLDSADAIVATVNQFTGLVRGLRNGTVTVTATATDGAGASASIDVTITNQIIAITDVAIESDTVIGNIRSLSLTITPTDATDPEVTWTSSNTDIATIEPSTDGLTANLIGQASGAVQVTVEADNDDEAEAVDAQRLFTVSFVLGVDQSVIAKIYPNPTTDEITISSIKDLSIVRLYTITGQLVKQIELSTGQQTINISDVASGTYLLELETLSKESYQLKLMKN